MKRKKVISILSVAALAITVLTGCATNSEAATNKANQLVDGTYRIEYAEANPEGWKDFMEMTVEEGKIVNVVFDSASEEGELYTEDDEMVVHLEQSLVETQDPTDMTLIYGMEETSDSFYHLAQELIDHVREGNTETIVVPVLQPETVEQ